MESCSGLGHIAHLRSTVSQLKICDFSGETFEGFEVLYNFLWVQRRHNCSPAGEFCKLRYDTIPVKSASANVSFCTSNSKMTNFELWHSCPKWALCSLFHLLCVGRIKARHWFHFQGLCKTCTNYLFRNYSSFTSHTFKNKEKKIAKQLCSAVKYASFAEYLKKKKVKSPVAYLHSKETK